MRQSIWAYASITLPTTSKGPGNEDPCLVRSSTRVAGAHAWRGGGEMGIALEDGSRGGVIGGGPAGSLFAQFLLRFAERMELAFSVDIYEPRDFTKPGPAGEEPERGGAIPQGVGGTNRAWPAVDASCRPRSLRGGC